MIAKVEKVVGLKNVTASNFAERSLGSIQSKDLSMGNYLAVALLGLARYWPVRWGTGIGSCCTTLCKMKPYT